MITAEELLKHNSPDDCWVSVEGKVYNITGFLGKHPGGRAILLKVAGTDATKQFLKFHPTSVIKTLLKPEDYMGELEASAEQPQEELTQEEKQLQVYRDNKPDLGEILNVFDFEQIAKNTMDRNAWYYYSSGAEDEITMRENHRAFQRIWFRPKVLVDVTKVDISTKFLGQRTAAPFYITATALAKLGHEDGEVCMTQAARKTDLAQMISTLASCTTDEIAKHKAPSQPLWQQIYVNGDRQVTADFIHHCEELGVTAFFVTVDAPQLGRREKDMRTKYDADLASVQDEDDEDVDRSQGAARAISSFIDPGLSWKDVPWLRKLTKKPLLLKGVQRWEDAVKAAKMGLDGVVLSNHGGRQLEYAPSAIEILPEVMMALKKNGISSRKFEVYVDGGIRRGTDVIKALCLGAKGVGIGRPFLYAMSGYGAEGVEHAIKLLKEEIEMNLRLIGAKSISDLGPQFVDIRSLHAHDAIPEDFSSGQVYEKMNLPKFKGNL